MHSELDPSSGDRPPNARLSNADHTNCLAGFNLQSVQVSHSVIIKRYLEDARSGQPFCRRDAEAMTAISAHYYAIVKAACIAVPQTAFKIEPFGDGYALIQSSRFLGSRNCADALYAATTLFDAFTVALALIEPWIHLARFVCSGLREDDLPIGLDNSPYNFVLDPTGRAVYVDFYPPRVRLMPDGYRLADSEVITDLPAARSDAHASHLIRCFYSCSGMLLHGLSHVLAAIDSNPRLTPYWPRQEAKLFAALVGVIAAAGLGQQAKWLSCADAGGELQTLRMRYRRHRHTYYRRFSRPVTRLEA